MNIYERLFLPGLIDCACGLKVFHEERAKVVPRARGRVLEIGIGSGHNLRHYDPDAVEVIEALDPASEVNPKAARRAEELGLRLEVQALSAEKIPVPDHSYDSVVCTFTLCSIPDVASALKEVRRVMKPGAEFLFCEHGLAPDASVQKWQERITPVWKRVAGGCHLNRDVEKLLRSAGFTLPELEKSYAIPGPRIVSYIARGTGVLA